MSFIPEKLSETRTFCGRTFTLYSLNGFKFDESIQIDGLEDVPGVYYFAKKRIMRNDNTQTRWIDLYLGKADNLENRPLNSNHGKWPNLKTKGCNVIGVYKCKTGENPKEVESEILAQYNFVENKTENS